SQDAGVAALPRQTPQPQAAAAAPARGLARRRFAAHKTPTGFGLTRSPVRQPVRRGSRPVSRPPPRAPPPAAPHPTAHRRSPTPRRRRPRNDTATTPDPAPRRHPVTPTAG